MTQKKIPMRMCVGCREMKENVRSSVWYTVREVPVCRILREKPTAGPYLCKMRNVCAARKDRTARESF